MEEKSPDLRRSLAGGALVALGLLGLLRLAGPARLAAILALGLGAFYLNKTDPRRLAAILAVVAIGFGFAAYRAWHR
ncbi:MAG: hypothetical protein V9G19_12560 [Tetrasphaera sp.]